MPFTDAGPDEGGFLNLDDFFFSDLISELDNLIYNKEKGELDDYECLLLYQLIEVIEKRKEFKKFKSDMYNWYLKKPGS